MKKLRILAVLLVCLLLFSACSKPELTESESAALQLAADYFAWSLQTLEDEYTILYETEVNGQVEGRECYLFTAQDTDGTSLVYAAVDHDAQDLWFRFTPAAEWEKVTEETWAEVRLFTEGVG